MLTDTSVVIPPASSREDSDYRSIYVEPPTLIAPTTASGDYKPLGRAEPFGTRHTQGGK